MRLDRKNNTIRNAVWGVINKILSLLGPFVVRTMLIYILGIEYLGLSSLFSSILEVLNMAELGFGSAVAYCMYSAVANDDKRELCALLKVFKKIYKIVGISIVFIGLILLPFLGYLIHGHVPTDINIYWLYLLYLGNSAISYLMCAYKSVLFSAFQRDDILNRKYSLLLIVQYVAQIAVLYYFHDYYAFYIIVPFITVAKNFYILSLTKQYFPDLQPQGAVSCDTKKTLRKNVSGIIISKFCGLTRNTFDSIILSTLLGLSTVAVYSNYYYILCNVAAMVTILVNSMKAGIGNSVAMDSTEKNHRDFYKFSFMYMFIISWVAICLLCLYQPFMKLWVHEENMFSIHIAALFAFYYFTLGMGDIIDVYSGAAGLWWENRTRCMVEAVANLVLNILFGYLWGVLGILLATIITIILCNFGWKLSILYKYYFKDYELSFYIKQYTKYIIVLFICAGFTLGICSLGEINSIFHMIFSGIVCLLLPELLLFIFFRNEPLFTESVIFIREIIRLRRSGS